MNNTKRLAVIKKAIVPKPTKDEIVTALAMLKIEQLTKEQGESSVKKRELAQEISSEMRHHAARVAESLSPEVSFWAEVVEVKYKFHASKIPVDTREKIKKHDSICRISIPSLNEAKQQVRAAMNGYTNPSDRVRVLLTDEIARNALEKTLNQLDKKDK